MEKKLDGNYTRMLRAILNISWRQHPTKQQLYGHLPPITKTIKIRRTRHVGHCWRSRDELISDVLLWTPSHGRAKAGRPARTYIQQPCADTGCSPEDLPEAMNDREGWQERVKDVRTDSVTWWWWWGYEYYLMMILSLKIANLKCSCNSRHKIKSWTFVWINLNLYVLNYNNNNNNNTYYLFVMLPWVSPLFTIFSYQP